MILYVRDSRERRVIDTATVAAFLFGCFVFGILAVRTTVYGLLLIGALFCLVLYWVKPQIMVSVALFLSFAALPEGLHIGKVFGPIPVYAYHVALILALCYLIPIVRPKLSMFRLPAMFLLTIVFFTEVGLAADNATDRVVHEAMYMVELVVGLVLALLIVYADYIKGTIYAVAATLWFSAGMVIAGSFHSIQLAGRSESMADMAGAVDTNRIITTAETPAIAALTTLVALHILGRGRTAAWFVFFPPALIITALTFARSTLLAIGVAALVAILTNMGWPTLRRTGTLLLWGAALLAITLPGALFLLQHSPAGAWLSTQITGYNNRVLGGVSTDALAVDESTLDRLRENAKLNHAIGEAPVFGHGLGYAYQMPFGNDPNWFTATLGTTYAHNFYLWWLCKTGAVGMSAFVWFALTPLIRGLRSTSSLAKASVAVSLGLLVICNVAPLPEEPASALVLGMALGSALAFANADRATKRDQAANAETIELQPLPQSAEVLDAA
ncbi:O-antigen ligase family protein [Candidatus Mycobacterium wuenschmannii]|uniref:O-antigen ligase family protein n=1 Tax=Candidatus Mycobacterium wuenschmannii TaxID=3027808 RepID=A0ABY8VSV1_9MYCO|nr:O-antigen ligase family protein [Candidatus Mycobacterium wuenschmannii]WIM85722.1 O-antigen ligase family protein [Candidatus Mycobacterium wuenschmannii]